MEKPSSNMCGRSDLQNVDPQHRSVAQLLSGTACMATKITRMENEAATAEAKIELLKKKAEGDKHRIKLMTKLPLLVGSVVEVLQLPRTRSLENIHTDIDSSAKNTNCVIVKTSMGSRTSYFLPNSGLIPINECKPNDLIAVIKDSYIIAEKLPPEYDTRIKAMEVERKPTEQYSDIGGLEKQIQELREAVVLPLTHKERFEKIGITPPKGVLLYGPPGTGKTMLARAVAAQTEATFLRLSATQLVEMHIGEGAKIVRDAFDIAKRNAPTIIFIDEIDAVGKKRFEVEKESGGGREVQRTMMELLNQLDGFEKLGDIKLIAATNRMDILDPALMRSGRLDRKIELPNPNEDARARIFQIHSRKMTIKKNVSFIELARCTDDFNGAQCRAVCQEAGMIALRRNATEVTHEDFMDGILEVQEKKKLKYHYFA